MRKIIAAAGALLATFAGLDDVAAEQLAKGPYIFGEFGYSLSREDGSDDFGNSPILGGGVGYRFHPNFRADVSLGWRGGYEAKDRDDTIVPGSTLSLKTDISSWAFLVNGYYDIITFGRFTPYVGGASGSLETRSTLSA